MLRIRAGDYRILYTVNDDVLTVLVVTIGHRRDVYQWLFASFTLARTGSFGVSKIAGFRSFITRRGSDDFVPFLTATPHKIHHSLSPLRPPLPAGG